MFVCFFPRLYDDDDDDDDDDERKKIRVWSCLIKKKKV
jgi:hypothetical protein